MTDRGPRLRCARLRRDGVRLPSSLRRLTVGIVAAGALLAGAAPAQAAVTSAFAGGQLTVRSDAGDGIAIWCGADATVRVNGAQPGTGGVACSKIAKIQVEGGPAGNVVDLSSVARTRFSGLAAGGVGIRGGGGDDALLGSAIADSIAGDEGNDFVDGDTGGDRLDGGTGQDRLIGFDGDDKLFGGEDRDRLEAEAGADHLEGEGGADRLLGGDDNDTVLGGDGDDDTLNGNGGDDTIGGGGGNDKLFGEADRDELAGDAGDDELTGDLAFSPNDLKGDDVVDGGEGEGDRVKEAADENFTLEADELRGIGSDCGAAEARTVTLRGVEAATLGGGGCSNKIDASAFGGPVTLLGSGGDDTLIGGPRNDVLGHESQEGYETGADTFTGAGGDDAFYGGPAVDTVVEAGDDFKVAGTTAVGTLAGLGQDKLGSVEAVDLTGGEGVTVFDGSGFSGKLILTGRGGDDRLLGGSGGNDLVEESGDVDFTLTDGQLQGRGSDELSGIDEARLTGGAGANKLDASGFSGKTVLGGGEGDDQLTGGARGDRLTGAAGDDTLAGNGGVDDLVDESGDVDFTLTDGQLEGLGSDELSGIEEARLTGGAGANKLDASGFSGKAVLDGGAGGDGLAGGAGDDALDGGDGGDGLIGGGGNDTESGGLGGDALFGGEGDDTLTGDAGVDAFSGEAGEDYLRTGDKTAESSIACGSDHDEVSADHEDRTSADCEVVRLPGVVPTRARRSIALSVSPTRTRSGGSVRMAGRLWAPTDPARCQRNQWVALQRARPGTRRFWTFKWVRTSGAAFTFTTRVTRTHVYRAMAPHTPRCLGAVSRAQRVTVTRG